MRNVGVCQSSFIQLTTPCIISGHLHSLDALNDTLLISGCGLRAVTDRERCFLALNDSNQPVFCIRVFFVSSTSHLQRGRILNILIKSVSEFNLIMSSPYALLTPDTDPSPVGGVGGVGGSAHLIHLLDGPTVPHHMGPNTHTHTHSPKNISAMVCSDRDSQSAAKTLNQPYGGSDPPPPASPSISAGPGFSNNSGSGTLVLQMSLRMMHEHGLGLSSIVGSVLRQSCDRNLCRRRVSGGGRRWTPELWSPYVTSVY